MRRCCWCFRLRRRRSSTDGEARAPLLSVQELLPEQSAKAAAAAASGADATAETCRLNVILASGNVLATLCDVKLSWTRTEVEAALRESLKDGQHFQGFWLGNVELTERDALGSLGSVKAGASLELLAVLGQQPRLHLFEPCAAAALAERRGKGWKDAAGRFIAVEGKEHASMDEAPRVAKQLAEALLQVCGRGLLESADRESRALHYNSEGRDRGEVVVISGLAGDDKDCPDRACMSALGLPHLQNCSFLSRITGANAMASAAEGVGFGFVLGDDRNEVARKFFVEKLSSHFEFTIDTSLRSAPVVYGGYCADGSIVGILSSRLWKE